MNRLSAAQAALYKDEADQSEVGFADQAQSFIQRALPKGAVILGLLFVVNAGSGFLAKKVLGHVFGAGPELDALWNAISLTSFPVTVLVLGGVIGPFLPLFVGLKGEADSAARDFARTILTLRPAARTGRSRCRRPRASASSSTARSSAMPSPARW